MGDSNESFMNNLETRMSAAMKRAYWDMIETDISNNDFRTTFAMVEEIRARICLLVWCRSASTDCRIIRCRLLRQMVT